jgi:hypothetical protein
MNERGRLPRLLRSITQLIVERSRNVYEENTLDLLPSCRHLAGWADILLTSFLKTRKHGCKKLYNAAINEFSNQHFDPKLETDS